MTDKPRRRTRGVPAGTHRLNRDKRWWDQASAQYRFWTAILASRSACLDDLREAVLPVYRIVYEAQNRLDNGLPVATLAEIIDKDQALNDVLRPAESNYQRAMKSWLREWNIENDWIEYIAELTVDYLLTHTVSEMKVVNNELYSLSEEQSSTDSPWSGFLRTKYPDLSFTYYRSFEFQASWDLSLGEKRTDAKKRIIEEYLGSFEADLDTFLIETEARYRGEIEAFPDSAFDWLLERVIPSEKGGLTLSPKTIRKQIKPPPDNVVPHITTIRNTTNALAEFLGLAIPELPRGPKQNS